MLVCTCVRGCAVVSGGGGGGGGGDAIDIHGHQGRYGQLLEAE